MKRRGFTLMELLVVIAILGILSSIVLGQVNAAREKAQIAKARLEVREIRNAVELLAADTGEWPGHQPVGSVQQDLPDNEEWDLNAEEAGITATDGSFPNWRGPYMSNVPLDPWGNPYFFDTDYDIGGSQWTAVVGSFGPNGTGQNIYDSDNIYQILAF